MIRLMLIAVLLAGCGGSSARSVSVECGQARLRGIWKSSELQIQLTEQCSAIDQQTSERGIYELSYPTWILIKLGNRSYGCNGSPAYPAPLEKLVCYDQTHTELNFIRE
jgi:hypothetical protein